MKFYTKQHRYTCGIDLHARSLYVCILDDTGQSIVHKQINASPVALLKLIAPQQVWLMPLMDHRRLRE